MNLRDLAGVDSDSEVTGFAIDHRKVAPGSIFGAFKGAVFNGEDFIGQAVERGVRARCPHSFVLSLSKGAGTAIVQSALRLRASRSAQDERRGRL